MWGCGSPRRQRAGGKEEAGGRGGGRKDRGEEAAGARGGAGDPNCAATSRTAGDAALGSLRARSRRVTGNRPGGRSRVGTHGAFRSLCRVWKGSQFSRSFIQQASAEQPAWALKLEETTVEQNRTQHCQGSAKDFPRLRAVGPATKKTLQVLEGACTRGTGVGRREDS